MTKTFHKILGLSLTSLSILGFYALLEDTIKKESKIQPIIKHRNTARKKRPSDKINTQSKAPAILTPWSADLRKLRAQNVLPSAWDSIKKVRVILLDSNLHEQIKGLKPPIRTNSRGRYILEVSFMSHETDDKKAKDEGKVGVITQYNLVDIETNEMLWEYSSFFKSKLK